MPKINKNMRCVSKKQELTYLEFNKEKQMIQCKKPN